MSSIKRNLFLGTMGFLTLFFLAACISVSKPGGVKPQNPLQQAEQFYEKGNFKEAARKYEEFLTLTPAPPRADQIWTTYGLAAEKGGLYDQAVKAYGHLAANYPKSKYTPEAAVRLATVRLIQKQYPETITLGQQWLKKSSGARKVQWADLTGRAYLGAGQYAQAVRMFLDAYNSTNLKSGPEEGLQAALAKLDQAGLEDIRRKSGQTFPGPEAAYFLIYRYLEAGEQNLALEAGRYFNRYFPHHRLKPAVDEVLAAGSAGRKLPEPVIGQKYVLAPPPLSRSGQAFAGLPANLAGLLNGDPALIAGRRGQVNIAAVLPLSSDQVSPYGQKVLRGLQLAVATYKPQTKGQTIGLLVMDSHNNPELAQQLVNQAAQDKEILAIAGPLTSREAISAAKAAQNKQLPLVAVSQRSDLPATGPYVFRVFLTPEHQAKIMARYAVKERGYKKLAVIYPNDRYGQTTKAAFEREAKALKGTLVGSRAYNLKERNWAAAVDGLPALSGKTAVYLPDSAASVAQLAPAISVKADSGEILFLGSSLWMVPSLASGSGRYLQNSVIPLPFAAQNPTRETAHFTALFQAAYNGASPDQFEAYGYDVGLLLLKAMDQKNPTRQTVRDTLASTRDFPGATGHFSFDAQGEYEVYPTLMTIKGSSFKLLKEAGPAK